MNLQITVKLKTHHPPLTETKVHILEIKRFIIWIHQLLEDKSYTDIWKYCLTISTYKNSWERFFLPANNNCQDYPTMIQQDLYLNFSFSTLLHCRISKSCSWCRTITKICDSRQKWQITASIYKLTGILSVKTTLQGKSLHKVSRNFIKNCNQSLWDLLKFFSQLKKFKQASISISPNIVLKFMTWCSTKKFHGLYTIYLT